MIPLAAKCGYLILVVHKQDRTIYRGVLEVFAKPCMHRSLKHKSARSTSLTGPERILNSTETEETWMLSEFYYADRICGHAWKSAVLGGGGALFKKSNAGNTRLLSKAETSAIVCSDLFDTMTVVRQRKTTTPC